MTDTLTPAQVEQRDLQAASAIAVREDQFALAPAGMYPPAQEWAALKEMARALCITEFVPKEMRGRPYAVLGALLTGRDLGLPAMMALRRIYVVNGRPSLEGAVKVALVRRAGHKIRVGEWTETSCTVRGWRRGDAADEVMEVTYTIEDAKLAGDYDKPGDTYKKRPRQMLYWRAAGLLCDTYFSDVTLGIPDPEEAAGLPSEVLEGQYVDADRRGQLPAMPTDMPLTDEERAAVEEQRQQQAAATLPETSTAPPPPRRRGRGPGAKPDPQQGSDGGAAGPAAATSSAATTAPPPASPSSGAASPAGEASSADIARGLGLDDLAERLERGEHVPDSGQEWMAARAAETAATAPEGGEATPAAPGPEQTSAGPAPSAGDPFDGEGAAVGADQLAQLRQRAETYGDFLMRRKLEKAGRSPASMAALHEEALAALEQIAQQMFRSAYAALSAEQLQGKMLPWLKQRYAAEGGTE